MAKQPYTKPPLPVHDQISLLKSRGLQIPDEPRAVRYLQNISYYRLSGYMNPFLADTRQHRYKDGTTFENIINLYLFDRELRLLIFSTIEKIEVALRSQISNQFSVTLQDPFWYTNAVYFVDSRKHTKFLKNLSTNISHSKDVFIRHFSNTYSEPFPPIWVIFEILPMGQFSILYSITKKSPPKKAVANYFGVKETVLTNWLHTLVYVRNICAHHARLWNKYLGISARLPKKTANKWLSASNLTGCKVYIVLAIIAYLLDTISPHNTFRQKTKNLIMKYPDTDIAAMGFPNDWHSDPFWL